MLSRGTGSGPALDGLALRGRVLGGLAVGGLLLTAVGCSPAHTTREAEPELPTFTRGLGLSEWRNIDHLGVRVLRYDADALHSAEARTDVAMVEECAPLHRTAALRHTRWRVVDADGTEIAGPVGKVVDGAPTEDPPATLGPGECATVSLAFEVPDDSDPAAVTYTSHARWVLPDD